MTSRHRQQSAPVTNGRFFLAVMIAACLYRGQIGGAVILAIVFLVLEVLK